MNAVNPATVVALMSWSTFEHGELSAAYLAATFSDRPRIPAQNISFSKARSLNLVSEDGSMHAIVFEALGIAVSRLEESL